ncbi:MAG: hypothetical protein PHF37_08965 [Phycisphaerae bacterium]|nr:hypothetical protein [Phycisphaerae bacterium]
MVSKMAKIVVPAFTLIILFGSLLKAEHVSGKLYLINKAKQNYSAEFRVRQNQDGAAHGQFSFKIGDGETKIDIRYIKVDGNCAWFAGKCSQDPQGRQNSWVFFAVQDGGSPGNLVDYLWVEWMSAEPGTEIQAKGKVDNLERPSESQSINGGNIIIS